MLAIKVVYYGYWLSFLIDIMHYRDKSLVAYPRD